MIDNDVEGGLEIGNEFGGAPKKAITENTLNWDIE